MCITFQNKNGKSCSNLAWQDNLKVMTSEGPHVQVCRKCTIYIPVLLVGKSCAL